MPEERFLKATVARDFDAGAEYAPAVLEGATDVRVEKVDIRENFALSTRLARQHVVRVSAGKSGATPCSRFAIAARIRTYFPGKGRRLHSSTARIKEGGMRYPKCRRNLLARVGISRSSSRLESNRLSRAIGHFASVSNIRANRSSISYSNRLPGIY